MCYISAAAARLASLVSSLCRAACSPQTGPRHTSQAGPSHAAASSQQPGPLLITRRTQIRNNSRDTASCEGEGAGTLLYNIVAVAWRSIGLLALADQVCVNSRLFSD